MSTPTPEQIERLPKWAQSHIKRLDRQRRTAITGLERFQDSDEPTPVSYEQFLHLDDILHLDDKCQFIARHIDTHEVHFVHNGASLTVRVPDADEHRGIELSWGPEGGHGLGDMCFTPTSYQQARITNLAYMPNELKSPMQRKKQAEAKKTT